MICSSGVPELGKRQAEMLSFHRVLQCSVSSQHALLNICSENTLLDFTLKSLRFLSQASENKSEAYLGEQTCVHGFQIRVHC